MSGKSLKTLMFDRAVLINIALLSKLIQLQMC